MMSDKRTLQQIAQAIVAGTAYKGYPSTPNIRSHLWDLAINLSGRKLQRQATDTDLLAVIIASLIIHAEKEQFMGPDTETENREGLTSSPFTNGYAIELVDETGHLAIPRYLAFREKPTLTNNINHATIFQSHEEATKVLAATQFDTSSVMSNGYLTVTLNAYHKESHYAYWSQIAEAYNKALTPVKVDTYTEPLLCASDMLEEVIDYAEQRKYNTALVLLEQAQRNLLDAYGRIAVKAADVTRINDH